MFEQAGGMASVLMGHLQLLPSIFLFAFKRSFFSMCENKLHKERRTRDGRQEIWMRERRLDYRA
jgi:hypothetical protein